MLFVCASKACACCVGFAHVFVPSASCLRMHICVCMSCVVHEGALCMKGLGFHSCFCALQGTSGLM